MNEEEGNEKIKLIRKGGKERGEKNGKEVYDGNCE